MTGVQTNNKSTSKNQCEDNLTLKFCSHFAPGIYAEGEGYIAFVQCLFVHQFAS